MDRSPTTGAHPRGGPAEPPGRASGRAPVWALGDSARLATAQTIVGERLCDRLGLHARERVLDIATGSGNAAIAAARRRARVVGLDPDTALLGRARERAAVERLAVDLARGRAESLPFASASMDAVVSTFGVMFADDPDRATDEILRVTRAGGRIGLACWTPDGFTGQLFRTLADHVPDLAPLDRATRWGTEAGVRERWGPRGASFELRREEVVLSSEAPDGYRRFFRTIFGPSVLAFRTLGPEQGVALEDEMLDVVRRFNHAKDGTSFIRSDYLEIVLVPTSAA